MQDKILEVRDRGTFIPVIALQIEPESQEQEFLICRAGFPTIPSDMSIILFSLNCNSSVEYDPFEWMHRTFQTAHRYIIENFDNLKDGDVIDVEFILGETTVKKTSESELK